MRGRVSGKASTNDLIPPCVPDSAFAGGMPNSSVSKRPREAAEPCQCRERASRGAERGEWVTTVGVCRSSGVDRNLIEKRPTLKELLRESVP